MNASTKPVALITGAARGIGRECAIALARSGFHLVLTDLEQDLPAELGAVCVSGDITDLALHPKLVQAAMDQWGRLDCLVNNAGVGVLRRGDLLDVSPESFDRCLSVNTRAVFFLSQAVARHMLRHIAPDEHHRSIINITSSNAVAVSIARGEYCVSKCASSMTTKLFALRLAEAGVGVYEVRPGVIETSMTAPVKALYDSLIEDGLVPMKRAGATPAMWPPQSPPWPKAVCRTPWARLSRWMAA